jgi:RHS repeat-associated protein
MRQCMRALLAAVWCFGLMPLAYAATTTTSSFTYDANGRTDLATDADNTVTDYDYDSRGLLTQRIDAKNDTTGRKRTIQTDWHATFAVPTERRLYDANDALVAKTDWTYNSRGQVLTQTQTDPATAVSRTTTTTYCEPADVTAGICPLVGLVTKVDGARTDVSDISAYTYYAADDATCATASTTCPHRKGDLWKVTNAVGQVTETLKYDGAGRVLSVKDANGVITDFEYHPRGWLTARMVRGTNNAVETDDVITRIVYWPTALVKQVTQPDGSYTAYTYDAAHRLTDVTDGLGNTIHYALDNAGNRTSEQVKDVNGALKRTLLRVYNQLGQLQTQTDAYAHSAAFTYDASGNGNLATDALSRTTDNDYDPLNRLSRTLQDAGGINAETSFHYDAQDNLTEVTDPSGLDTSYQYNGLGDLQQITSPDTGVTIYTYDSIGNRKTQTDARSKTTTYGYDALNRLASIDYATSTLDETFTYDTTNAVCASGETFAKGHLTKTREGSSNNIQYCYDRFGNLVRKVQTTNSKVFTVRYAYNKAGEVTSLTYPDGAVADYVRDTQGRITEVGITRVGASRQVLLGGVSYYPFGPPSQWTFGNGRSFLRTLDQNYQPNTIDDGTANGLSIGYEFDAAGNFVKLRNASQSDPALITFGYDGLNRLTDVMDGPTSAVLEHYGYNATGDRTSLTTSAGTTTYGYFPGTHRLQSVGAVSRTYDAAGNTLSVGGSVRQYTYSDAGRMDKTQQNNVTVMNYRYDAYGEQVHRYLTSTGTNQTFSAYDEGGHWLGDYDSTGSPLQQAIWMEDLPVGVLDGASTGQRLVYLEADALGTPRVAVDPLRNVPVWSWDLKGEAFGATIPNQDPDSDAVHFVLNLRFPGHRYDAASGLSQNWFRDFEPATGRYSQPDPSGLNGGINAYGYVHSNPLNSIDPDGLNALTIPWWIETPLEVVGTCTVTTVGVVGVGAMLMAFPNSTSVCDTRDKPPECRNDDDDRCRKATIEARDRYHKLMAKRIPQFQSGGIRGRDPKHLESILQLQQALRDAIRRVKFYCNPPPAELAEWQRAASLTGPGF